MISLELARQLRDAGLIWRPADGDRFIVPDRAMDDQIFTISSMTVESRESPVGPLIAFNGVVEWALDAIERREVVWLPREDQLRQRLGSAFETLFRISDDEWHCTIQYDDQRDVLPARSPAEAYGLAVLTLLRHSNAALFDSA